MSTIDVLNMFTSYFLTLSLYCLILGRFHPVKSDFFSFTTVCCGWKWCWWEAERMLHRAEGNCRLILCGFVTASGRDHISHVIHYLCKNTDYSSYNYLISLSNLNTETNLMPTFFRFNLNYSSKAAQVWSSFQRQVYKLERKWKCTRQKPTGRAGTRHSSHVCYSHSNSFTTPSWLYVML